MEKYQLSDQISKQSGHCLMESLEEIPKQREISIQELDKIIEKKEIIIEVDLTMDNSFLEEEYGDIWDKDKIAQKKN